MNQSVKQGLLIVIGVLLIASLVALFKFYVTTPKGYFTSTDDEVAYSKTPNDHFKEAKLPFPENLSNEKSPPSVPPSDKTPSASTTSTRTSTEHFSYDKSPTDCSSK